jgi:predicted glycoside hydrolase/deacetylase ChbG (UPF0249 family)
MRLADRPESASPAGLGVRACVADDWGMSPGINEGILELCEGGLVRTVSILAGSPHVERGLSRLLGDGGLSFSLHLNLTHGVPLSSPKEVPSLCGPGGSFLPPAALLRRAAAGRLDRDEVRLETRAQIRALKRLAVPLSGVEGHHHVHLLPPVFAAAAPILLEEGLDWIRLPADRAHVPSWAAGAGFRLWRRFASPEARRLRLRRALYLTAADRRSAAALDRKLLNAERLPVIVHPAKYDDLALMAHPDPLREERVEEHRTLLAWAREKNGADARA